MTDYDPHVAAGAEFLEAALPADFRWDPDEPDHPVAQYNDHAATRHADVMTLYDRAIVLAREGGARRRI